MSAMRFTRDHEWVRMEDADVGVVGITDHAQEQLGDLVHAELPEPGRELGRGDEAAVVESVKAAGEIHSPLAGTVTEVNTALVDDPGLANQDPLGAGWFFKLRLAVPDEFSALMDEAAYREYLDS